MFDVTDMVKEWCDVNNYEPSELSTDELVELMDEFFDDFREAYSSDVFAILRDM